MASKLLIIESSLGSAVPSTFPLPAPSLRMTWSEFAAHKTDAASAQLILAGSSHEIAPSLSFLSELRSSRLPVPVLALLPASTDGDLLKAAAEVADDFIFCPL